MTDIYVIKVDESNQAADLIKALDALNY